VEFTANKGEMVKEIILHDPYGQIRCSFTLIGHKLSHEGNINYKLIVLSYSIYCRHFTLKKNLISLAGLIQFIENSVEADISHHPVCSAAPF